MTINRAKVPERILEVAKGIATEEAGLHTSSDNRSWGEEFLSEPSAESVIRVAGPRLDVPNHAYFFPLHIKPKLHHVP